MESVEYEIMRSIEERHWWFVARRRIILSMLRRLVAGTTSRVLDFGCGCGGNTAFFSEQAGFDVTGVDVSEQAIEYCRGRGLENVSVIPAENWEPVEGEYDVALALDVLEHIDDDTSSVRALWRSLKPGGVLMAAVPAYPFLWTGHDVSLHHFRRYTKGTLDELADRAGLGGWDYRSYYNFFLFPPVLMIRGLRKLRGAPDSNSARSVSDTSKVPPGIINGPLRVLFESEKVVLGRLGFPFGVSLIAWARKPSE